MVRQKVNFRLTDEARQQLKEMAHATGISQAAVIEILVRDNYEVWMGGKKR